MVLKKILIIQVNDCFTIGDEATILEIIEDLKKQDFKQKVEVTGCK